MDKFDILHRIRVASHYDHSLGIEINFNPLRWHFIHLDKDVYTETNTLYGIQVQVVDHSWRFLFLSIKIFNKTPVPEPEPIEYTTASEFPQPEHFEPEWATKIREDIATLRELIEKSK